MTAPNTPPSQADLARLVKRVKTLERAITPAGPRRLDALDDVAVPQPATGTVLTFDGTKWVPGPAGSGPGASGFYAGGNSPTSVPDSTFHTDLEWPTLLAGTALLDLSDQTAPTVLTDGVYFFTAVVQPGSPPTDVKVEFVALDSPLIAGTEMHIGSATRNTAVLIGFCPAGTVLELAATQTSGSSLDVNILIMNVTRIG